MIIVQKDHIILVFFVAHSNAENLCAWDCTKVINFHLVNGVQKKFCCLEVKVKRTQWHEE